MNLNVKMKADGQEFWVSARQASALQTLSESNKGGFASVKGYRTSKNQVANYTVLTRFNTPRLYQRRIAALEAIEVGDIMDSVRANPKLAALSVEQLCAEFEARKATEIASLQKTLEGSDRDDAHRAAHDRNYATITDGVKVHFKSEKNSEGVKVPVLHEGLPIVESIMLAIVEVKRDILVEGDPQKPVNSGVPVLLSNAMMKLLPKSTFYQALSLKDDNFDSIAIGGNELVPADIRGDYT